jgi:hypothetical protein
VLVSAHARPEVQRVLPGLALNVMLCTGHIDLLTAQVESACPQVLIIDTDLIAVPGDLRRFARSLRPDVQVVALVNHWSEREERLKDAVDAVLHKPPRRDEWERLFG